jgi:hypothetical protein
MLGFNAFEWIIVFAILALCATAFVAVVAILVRTALRR